MPQTIGATGRRRWEFDPHRAVDLLTEVEQAAFSYELELNLYLLMMWSLMPSDADRVRIKGAARRLAGIITFSPIAEQTGLIDSTRRLLDIKAVQQRFRAPWYQTFYAKFVRPLGGLPSLLSVASLNSSLKGIRDRTREGSIIARPGRLRG